MKRLFLFQLICTLIIGCNRKPMEKHKTEVQLLPNNHGKNLNEVIALCESKTKARFEPILNGLGSPFPPANLSLLCFKEERIIEVFTKFKGKNIRLHSYPVLAASGKRGPKQQEGDKKVPEGVYSVVYLNPNSQFHLSFKLNYPNTTDLLRAKNAGIQAPGSDIFIHGNEKSIGCLAIGNPAIEELFTLVSLTGIEKTEVLIFPNDARKSGAFLPCEVCPADVNELYTVLLQKLESFN